MKKSALAIALVLSLATACDTDRKGRHAKYSADCESVELEWTGDGMCQEEMDKTHTDKPAAYINYTTCPGIHIMHLSDYTLDLKVLKENSDQTCGKILAWDHKFPYQSKNGGKQFHTDKITDKKAVGCTYEIVFTPLDQPKACDPHVIIGDGT